MLYVFLVDTGTMLTFDMKLAMESVTTLQSAIAKECHISEDKQVLLISGGETLDPTARVGKYHAGTDTSPIFLFSKTTIEAMTPPSPSVHYGSDVDIQSQVEGSMLLPPIYATVVSRAQLSLQIDDVDREEIKACEKLVHDQHLQQQGWAAVVANLEDITSALKTRFEIFIQSYDEYLQQRVGYKSTLTSIITSLQLLSKIPVLPCLLSETASLLTSKSLSSTSSDKSRSLYDWISSQDPNHNLNDMVDQCVKDTDQLDQNIKETLTTEVADTFQRVDNSSMKEVNGLEDWLYTLDQFMSEARKIVLEQSDMSQAFVQNQNRLTNLRDNSILPDLCSSHRKQLQVMVTNHKKLREIKKKCKMAKEELAVNLHTRLRWVMLVEKMICDVDGKLMIYHEKQKRLRKRMDILRQIHEAPKVYAQLVVEVVRRKKFAQQFTEWSSSLSEDFRVLHSDELKRRKSFQTEVGHHFLQTLFQGFEDIPPTVFNEPVVEFDHKLPEITLDDINMLKEAVPELACDLGDPIEATFQILVADVCRGRAQLKTANLATSEIEIIKSFDEDFLNTNKSNLSLCEQMTDTELDANIVIQGELVSKNMDSTKPELIMPRSLSKDLTKRVREEEHKKSCDVDDIDSELKPAESSKSDIVLPTSQKSSAEASMSSAEQVKSTESDLSGHENTQHSADEKVSETGTNSRKIAVRPRTTSGLSPDMETSQEFTTADFYIEDSMPSSIADSPPTCGKATEEKPSAEKQLEHKATLTEKLEKEIMEYKQKYSSTLSKFESVQKCVNIQLPEIRSQLKLLESNYRSNQSEFQENFETMMKTIADVICSFDSQRVSENKCNVEKILENSEKNQKTLEENAEKLCARISELELEKNNIQEAFELAKKEFNSVKTTFEQNEQSLKTELEKTRSDLQVKMSEANDKVKAFDLERAVLQKEIQASRDKFQALEEGNIKSLSEAKEKYEFEIADLKKQHSLEMEVELDKLRADLKDQIDELEMLLQEKENKLLETKKVLDKSNKEISSLEENLMERFQKEKDHITRIMEEDFEKKLKTCLEEEKDELTKKHAEDKEVLCNKNREELKELQAQIDARKHDEFNNMKSEIEKKFLKIIEENEEKFMKDKEATLVLQAAKMKEEYGNEFEAMKQELVQERDKLLLELKTFTNRDLLHQESQTKDAETKHGEQQTEILDVTTNETQTPHLKLLVGQSQTDTKEHSQKDIQTEIFLGKNTQSQTDKTEVKQNESQTKILKFAQGQVQTDVKEFAQKEAQTKAVDQTEGESRSGVEGIEKSDLVTKEEYKRELTELQARLTKEKAEAVDQEVKTAKQQFDEEVQKLKAEHDKEIAEIIAKLEKDKEDSLGSLKTSMTAEKQVMFNEAVNKVSQEKDKIIETLRLKEEELLQQQKMDKETLDKVMEDKNKAEDLKTRAMSHLSDKEREFVASRRQFESEIALVKQQLTEYQQQIQSMSHMAVSATPSVMNISTTEDKDTKIGALEGEIKSKNEEITNLHQKLNELTMSTSTRSLVQDKVSITSCGVGDLVLFCLDERHDQYIVFTIGTTLHFLHTDCLDDLCLRTNPGETKKSWVLAEITEKEYCQAKKPQNRFKVQVGTKFYRVKAKPWSRSRDAQVPVTQASVAQASAAQQ